MTLVVLRVCGSVCGDVVLFWTSSADSKLAVLGLDFFFIFVKLYLFYFMFTGVCHMCTWCS